jgi:NAD(P)H-dependent FMN reductase
MITIISGSNRKDNKTILFAKYVYKKIKLAGEEVKLLDLAELEGEFISSSMYNKTSQPRIIEEIQNQYFIPAQKFWFFIPEYNGSYPGVVKVLIDAMSTRDSEKTFKYKKSCLTGISLGRAGNLRGMDHLTEVLNHMGVLVHPNKKPISSIFRFFDENNELNEGNIKQELDLQVEELLQL